ncbi:MAG: hypothetical protein M3Y89_16630 [Actinomycetota bacterium]|nr:hypothetical protein [Actinomycetota bacterium]
MRRREYRHLLQHAPLAPAVMEELSRTNPADLFNHPALPTELALRCAATAPADKLAGMLTELLTARLLPLLPTVLTRLLAELEPAVWRDQLHALLVALEGSDPARTRVLVPPAVWQLPAASGTSTPAGIPVGELLGPIARFASDATVAQVLQEQSMALLRAGPSGVRTVALLLTLRPGLNPLVGHLLNTLGGEFAVLEQSVAAVRAQTAAVYGHLQSPCTQQCPYVWSLRGSAGTELLHVIAYAQTPNLHPDHARALREHLRLLGNRGGAADDVSVADVAAVQVELAEHLDAAPCFASATTFVWTAAADGSAPVSDLYEPGMVLAGPVFAAQVDTYPNSAFGIWHFLMWNDDPLIDSNGNARAAGGSIAATVYNQYMSYYH